jgi:hypothetical protein
MCAPEIKSLIYINDFQCDNELNEVVVEEVPMANRLAMPNVQKELLDTCEQINRAWLARVKSEVDLWSDLAAKLATTHSIPEAMTAYQHCVTHRMQMAAEDGRRLYEDCQKMTHKITDSLSHGLPTTTS